jgi:integrase
MSIYKEGLLIMRQMKMTTDKEPKRASKTDLYNKGLMFFKMYEKLSQNKLLSIKENNEIVKLYIDSKQKGYYRSIVYDVNNPQLTCAKNMSVLKKIEESLKKPFSELVQKDIDDLQQKLNANSIFTNSVRRGNKLVEPRPISHKYKLDIVVSIRQFWRFYRLYCKYELGKEMPDIVEFLKVRRLKNSNKMIQFLTKDELEMLVKAVRGPQMQAFLNVFFETGARVIEILKLKYGNCMYDNEKKTWIIKLPNEKGKSTQKLPIELTFSSGAFDLWISSNNFQDEDYVFQYSYDYLRKKLSYYAKKVIGRHVTPKEFRKGMAMYLVNNNVNEQYIRAHMGWSPSSDAIAHYINQKAIKRPDQLNKAIQTDFYSDVIKENENLKFVQKKQEDELTQMREEMKSVRKEQLEMFSKLNEIDVSASKHLVRAVFEEMKQKENSKET